METAVVPTAPGPSALSNNATAQALGGEDFFKLLIAQLSNQDPLDPTSNQELLQQISSIRDIELSTTLVESLQTLTGQQNYGAAASLIGRFVTGRGAGDETGAVASRGVVVGVRFDENGAPMLQLDQGGELSMADLESVVPAAEAAKALIGRMVTGLDTGSGGVPALIQGVVTGVRSEVDGRVLLELDTGQALDLTMVTSAVELTPDEVTGTAA
ncbi:MAG: flagellar hook assembly protein FlgD [Phycisphaerae bacterium]